jgi:hypothetical protein
MPMAEPSAGLIEEALPPPLNAQLASPPRDWEPTYEVNYRGSQRVERVSFETDDVVVALCDMHDIRIIFLN